MSRKKSYLQCWKCTIVAKKHGVKLEGSQTPYFLASIVNVNNDDDEDDDQ